MASDRYTYIKLPGEEKRFFCIQQNPLGLAWLLFFKKNTLLPRIEFNGLAKSRFSANDTLRGYYSFSRANVRKIIAFLKYKFHFRDYYSSVNLPFYGQVCVLVNKGYKIFDLRRKVAIKVYRDDVDVSTIKAELERLKKGSLFAFGPSIRKINITERFYEEDYVSGFLDNSPRPRNSQGLLEKFYSDVVPCLVSLLLHQPPKKINISDYLQKMLSTLKIDNLLTENSNAGDIDYVLSFIHSMKERLQSEGNISVLFVLTHGDFCPANMLSTKEGLKLLDWESATHRSALFDFYSYFFFRPLHQKLPVAELTQELNTGLSFYLSRLASISGEVLASVQLHEKTYRWLFYVERIWMLVERVKYDTKLNTQANIRRYIHVFNEYEELIKNYNKETRVQSRINLQVL